MGFLKALFGNPVEDVKAAIDEVIPDENESEAQYRKRLARHLATKLDVTLPPKSEAGVTGLGTRLDLYLMHDEIDFLISIKKGISEQKMKVLLGEALVLRNCWTLRELSKRAVLIIVVMVPDGKPEKFASLLQPIVLCSNFLAENDAPWTVKDFKIEFCIPGDTTGTV